MAADEGARCPMCGRLVRLSPQGRLLAHVTTTKAGFFVGCGGRQVARRTNSPGACADPVLHADPANPVYPPFYEPGGPFVDVPEWAKEAPDA